MGKLADIEAPPKAKSGPLFGEAHLIRQGRNKGDNYYCWEQRKRGQTGNTVVQINIDGAEVFILVTAARITVEFNNRSTSLDRKEVIPRAL